MLESVRAIQVEDLDAIHAIEQENFRNPWSYESIKYMVKKYPTNYVIVDDHNLVIGFVLLLLADDECQILNFAIKQSLHGQGFGSKLLHYMLATLPSHINAVYLEVRQSNISAQKLYEKFGFKYVGIRKNYYNFGNVKEDAKLYKLEK